MLSGIEVLPMSVGKVRPLRIRAGWISFWQHSAGEQWRADSYFPGGNALVPPPIQLIRTATPSHPIWGSTPASVGAIFVRSARCRRPVSRDFEIRRRPLRIWQHRRGWPGPDRNVSFFIPGTATVRTLKGTLASLANYVRRPTDSRRASRFSS